MWGWACGLLCWGGGGGGISDQSKVACFLGMCGNASGPPRQCLFALSPRVDIGLSSMFYGEMIISRLHSFVHNFRNPLAVAHWFDVFKFSFYLCFACFILWLCVPATTR